MFLYIRHYGSVKSFRKINILKKSENKIPHYRNIIPDNREPLNTLHILQKNYLTMILKFTHLSYTTIKMEVAIMNRLWRYIENKDWNTETKYKFLLLIIGVLSAVAGFITWLLIRPEMFATVDWMLCFIGYPVFISWFIVFFYSCRHDFHDGRPER